MNLNYRTVWTIGMNAALTRLEQLKTEGWDVELDRGAMMQRQAEDYINRAELNGFQTMSIPVADWCGETAQFVAFKAKTGITPTSSPDTTQTAMERFMFAFWHKPLKSDNQGALMNNERTAAVIMHNSTNKEYLKMVETIKSNSLIESELDYIQLEKAEKAGKTKLKIGPTGNVLYDIYPIDLLKTMIKILGDANISPFVYGHHQPLLLENPSHDKVVITPLVSSAIPPAETIDFEELKNL